MLKAQKQKPWVRTWAAAKLAHLKYVQKANTQPGFGGFFEVGFHVESLIKVGFKFSLENSLFI